MTDTIITVIGNMTADPELRFTASGAPVANFTVASTPRKFDKNTNEWKDEEALFLRCAVWRQLAENVAETFHKGDRVIVQGKLKQRSYEKDGERRTSMELEVIEVGVSLAFATAVVSRNARNGNSGSSSRGNSSGSNSGGWGQQQPAAEDPWGSAPAAGNEEPPF